MSSYQIILTTAISLLVTAIAFTFISEGIHVQAAVIRLWPIVFIIVSYFAGFKALEHFVAGPEKTEL